eukprot:scaffold13669_cov78-Skeletonema_dohrnii-CCMP3373.AAC.1
MPNVYHQQRIIATLDMGNPSSSDEGCESVKILIHRFADLPSASGQFTQSSEFTYNGHRWCIKLYPGGHSEAREGYLSLHLRHCSGGYATAAFEVSILDKYQSVQHTKKTPLCNFCSKNKTWGWNDYYPRHHIFNQSKNILDDNGTLAVVVSIRRDDAAPFIPNNPMKNLITGMFLDEKTADVCFEVGSTDAYVDAGEAAASSPVTFHAHRLILKKCAPMLASLFGSDDEEIATASINDVKPAIFHHMLHYVYGGSVEEGELNTHAKDIINAADKYSIIHLKLEAEAAYVKSTIVTMDNAIDNLLYADSMNLALLKEVVMDFLAENSTASQNLDFTNVPSYLMKDVFVAFGRKANRSAKRGKDYDLSVMSVSELRRKLDEKGLNVDGSREAMIEALTTNNADESADAKRQRSDADDSLEE